MSERRLLIVAATLALAASVWLLPRAVSSDVPELPTSIELRSGSAPTASPEAAAPSEAVDGRGDDDDDGGERPANGAVPRTSRESVPEASTQRADDGGDDRGDDQRDDADDGGDDTDDGGDDTDDGDDDGGDD